ESTFSVSDPSAPTLGLTSAALSDDGAMIVVGAVDGDGGKGAAYILTRSGVGWEQGATLTGEDTTASSSMGTVVGVEGDWIAVGAEGNQGAVYLFRQVAGEWQAAGKLQGDAGNSGAFGRRLAMDGDRIAVAAPDELDNRG